MTEIDIHHLRQWIGREECADDIVTHFPLRALSATLNREDLPPRDGDALPPLWHWLFFLPISPLADAGPDGHPKRGGFLPPVPLPRRMWAGSRLDFRGPLRVGEKIRRVSRIAEVALKQGRAGPLVFVLIRHEITGQAGGAIIEEHDIVYRAPPSLNEPAPTGQTAPAQYEWSREIAPDDVLLFRYSALTFNSHRIHYDRRYVTEVEGYPGLVVHGPLIATLLIDLLRRNCDRRVAAFAFRAINPLYDTAPFAVQGGPGPDGKIDLWARNAGGNLCMRAKATLA